MNETLLDNVTWNSLTTTHAPIAVGSGLARRFPASIGPLSGLQQISPEAWSDLAAITPPGDIAILFLDEKPTLPEGWKLLRDGELVQMVCRAIPAVPLAPAPIQPLGPGDVADMVALATLTEPGPFREGTIELGGFLGIRIDGRLAAMAGQRLAPGNFSEISAVCTHPDFRGRGYARALVAAVTHQVHNLSRTPFLSALASNTGALRVYEEVGFVRRRSFELTVVKPPVPA